MSCPPYGLMYVYPDREQYFLYDPTLGYYRQRRTSWNENGGETNPALDPTLPHEF
jgi:hypothetical protein